MRPAIFAVFLVFFTPAIYAADVGVVGLFPGKAVLVVDGAAPRSYSIGSTVAPGIRLVAASESGAILSNNGKQEILAIGQHAASNRSSSDNGSVTLSADGRGHFITQGQINGGTIRMLVDTGASKVALPASDAVRLGINYKKGQPGFVSTANGTVPAYNVKLDTVKIGDLMLHQVDGIVLEQGLSITLLGMSFLNRTEMRRDGDSMSLRKRY